MKQNVIAKNIMITNPLALRANMPITEAISLLTKSNTQGAPVLDETGVLVGFLSFHDVMVDLWCQYYAPNQEKVVADLMSSKVTSINSTETLYNIVELLCIDKNQLYPTSNMGISTTNNLSSISVEERAKSMNITNHQVLPVLDNGALVGVITRLEVIQALQPLYGEKIELIQELACA